MLLLFSLKTQSRRREKNKSMCFFFFWMPYFKCSLEACFLFVFWETRPDYKLDNYCTTQLH